MSIESNPASRLHALLQMVLSGSPNGNSKLRMLEVWAIVLGVSERQDVEVARRLVLLNEMLDDTERTIKLNPDLNHATYLSCFPQIRAVFSPMHLNSSYESLTQNLTGEVMARLEFCSEALRKEWSEVELTADELQELSVELNDLIENVALSTIAPVLRKALLEALESARIAISLYRVYGAKGLRKNLQSLFGFVCTEHMALKKESEQNPDVLERLGKWIDKIDAISSMALKVHKALNKPVQFLIEMATKSSGSADEEDTEPVIDT